MEPLPDSNTVELRWLAVETVSGDDWSRLLAVLDPMEQVKAARFRSLDDRQSYIAAHALTRLLLSGWLGSPAAALRFTAGPDGKPEIDDGSGTPPLRFNLSHTRGMVALAVSRHHAVGVDVEAIDSQRLSLDFAAQAFAPSEADYLRQLPATAFPEAGFAFWTLKEAYAKATGRGLTSPFDAFAFSLDPMAIRFSAAIADDPARWLFRQWKPSCSHILSLALRHDCPAMVTVNARAVHPERLLHNPRFA